MAKKNKKNNKKLKNTEYFVSIDWLQFSFHELDITEVLSILHGIGLGAPSKWGFLDKGMYGYKARLLFDSAIVLFSPDGSRTDIHVSLPGSIVRRVDLVKLWEYSAHFTVSRIDFAYDIMNYPVDSFSPKYFFNAFKKGDVVTDINYDSSRLIESSGGGCTVYFGSPKSERMLRIYDKGIESGECDNANEWIRIEYQVRHDMAQKLVGGNFVPSPDKIALAIQYLMRHFVYFVQDRSSASNHNIADVCPCDTLWQFFFDKLTELKYNLTDNLMLGSLYKKGNYLKRKLEWVFNQCSGSIAYVISLFGSIDKFYEFFDSSGFKCLTKFFSLYPQYKNIEYVDGNFMIDDFEIDYSSQGSSIFNDYDCYFKGFLVDYSS